MKRKIALLLVVVLCCSLFSACSNTPKFDPNADDWQYLQDKGEITIGITLYEPMNYYDNAGKLVGFDTEFAEAACAKLGLKPNFVEINWDTKEVELKAGTIDCIWNGLTIQDDRKENMDFSDPYVKNMQVVVIRKADAAKYTDTASLSDSRLVAEVSSAGEGAVAANADLAKANYVGVTKQTDALMEVKAGTADAAVLDYVLAVAMVGDGTDYSDLQMISGLELNAEEYGIGFRKGSSAVEKFNEQIKALTEDGTMDAIAAKYDMTNQLISNQ